MKKLLQKIWGGIRKIFNRIKHETKELVPVAVKIVQGVKNVMDSPVDDILLSIITAAIPGDGDDKLVAKIKGVVETWVPKLLLELRLVEGIANISDPNEQLKAILAQLKLSSNETKNVIYHGLASLVLEKLSDGELSWSDSVAISEYYYRNIGKK